MLIDNQKFVQNMEKFEGIDIGKIIPKRNPFWIETPELDLARTEQFQRKKELITMNLIKQKFILRKRLLPEHFTSLMEYSCRAPFCPLCFNLDVCASGACFNCIYCFAKFTECSLYSAFFDNYEVGRPRFASKEFVRKTLRKELNLRTTGFKQAVKQRIPLRIGNRSEDFMPIDRLKGVGLEALKEINRIGYPILINTKSDLIIEEPYFKLLTSMPEKVAIQVSIIHCNDSIAKRLEPIAPSSTRRWEVIKTFNEVGIEALPRLEPIMAFINSDLPHLKLYADKILENKAKRILMDTYSFTTQSPSIRSNFLAQGFDFDRMFQTSSEYQTLGSLLILRAFKIFKEKGIKTASFDFHSIPFNDTEDCCCLGDYYDGRISHYNLAYAIREIMKRGRMSFKEFDDKYRKDCLSSEIRETVKKIMNQEIFHEWCLNWSPNIIIDGRDSEGNIIYRYEPYAETEFELIGG